MSENSAVNLSGMEAMGQLFTCSMNCVTSSLSIFQIEKNILCILFFTFLSVLINEI